MSERMGGIRKVRREEEEFKGREGGGGRKRGK